MTICQESIHLERVRQIQAIACDYSGVLFNDRSLALDAVNDTLKHFGFPRLNLPEFRNDFRLPYYSLFTQKGIDVESAKSVCIRKYRERYSKQRLSLGPFDDTRFAIKTLTDWGLKLAVASQTPRFQLDDQLIGYDLHWYFSSILACGDVSEEKPSPLPLLETARRIGVKPENMAYVGDMYEDIQCARNAGVTSVALARPEGSYHTRNRLMEGRPDLVIASLTELVVLLASSQMRAII